MGEEAANEQQLFEHIGEPRTLTILGATGSIGDSTLDLVSRHRDKFKIRALTGHSNVEALVRSSIVHNADMAVIGDPQLYAELKDKLSGTRTTPAAGHEALCEAASLQVDLVMSACVGAAGLAPTMAALESGNDVALANKESLVCGGEMVLNAAKQSSAHIFPVDSEHNAIYQVLNQTRPQDISRIILTASGGPFRNTPHDQMDNITVQQALDHPNWSMGKKITIDSATMMNKGLELIEAYYLFPVSHAQLDVVVHPQSVIHSLVEYIDGSTLAQMGEPDMRIPISYALAWPARLETPCKKLDLGQIGRLDFEPVDDKRFPALTLAKECLRHGQGRPIILNAANEIAVAAFLQNQISFPQITKLCAAALTQADARNLCQETQSLEEVMALDAEARQLAETLI